MKRAALAIILTVVVLTAAMSGFAQAKKAEKHEKAKDPVCGMMVEKDPKLSTSYRGETYFFCSRTDLDEFRKSPDKYVKK